tara:strand:- start:7091 stop:8464 length:1374 start_codon:yes stop_codon:yes gene_type:complete
MNLSLLQFIPFLLLAIGCYLYRPRLLFLILPLAIFVVPTWRLNIVFPLYLYDLVAVLALSEVVRRGALQAWPRTLPPWHYYFLSVFILLGAFLPILRYGAHPEIIWIIVHAGLSYSMVLTGFALLLVPALKPHLKEFLRGISISLVLLAAIAMLERNNLGMVNFFHQIFYPDLDSRFLQSDFAKTIFASRVPGPFLNSNAFGAVAVLLGATMLVLTDGRQRALALACVALIIFATVSRQCLIALAVIAICALVFRRQSQSRALAAIAALLALPIGVSLATVLPYFSSWTERLGRWQGGILSDSNIVARVINGPERLAALINEYPFVLLTGVGLDIQKLAAKGVDVGALSSGFVSNSFLLALYSFGFIGLVLFISFWAWALIRASRVPASHRHLAIGAVAGSIVLFAADNTPFILEGAIFLNSFLVGAVAAMSVGVSLKKPHVAIEPSHSRTIANPNS